MQTLAQKQAEILQKSMQEAQAAMQGITGGQPAASAGNPGELIQQAFQNALSNMRELAEMAGKSQAQAMEVVEQARAGKYRGNEEADATREVSLVPP